MSYPALITYDQFKNKYNNVGIDFDGSYGFQCVDLADQYAREVVGADLPLVAGAKDFWALTIPHYMKIANSPTNIPQQGDIIIWSSGVGPNGHIAVFDHGTVSSFVSFDQNWPVGSLCHLQEHNYKNVLGWFRPLTSVPPVLIPKFTVKELTAMLDQAVAEKRWE